MNELTVTFRDARTRDAVVELVEAKRDYHATQAGKPGLSTDTLDKHEARHRRLEGALEDLGAGGEE